MLRTMAATPWPPHRPSRNASRPSADVAPRPTLAEVKIEIAKLDGKIDRLAIQLMLLIILALVAIAMFSRIWPNWCA